MPSARVFFSVAFPVAALATLAGCSDPPPPAPEAAWTINLQPSAADSSLCRLGDGHAAGIGKISENKRDQLLSNGIDGAEITCSVIGDKTFKVAADAAQGDAHITIDINQIAATATAEMPATGTLSYASDKTARSQYTALADKPCQFYFVPDSGEGVSPGTIWFAFRCPTVVDASTASTCQISQGYASFANCLAQ